MEWWAWLLISLGGAYAVIAITVTVIGLLTGVTILRFGRRVLKQTQRSGDDSVNFQCGGDFWERD